MHFAMTFFTARGTSRIQVLSVTHMSELPPKISKALIERSFQDDPVRNVVRSQRSGFTRLAFISYFVDVDRFFFFKSVYGLKLSESYKIIFSICVNSIGIFLYTCTVHNAYRTTHQVKSTHLIIVSIDCLRISYTL